MFDEQTIYFLDSHGQYLRFSSMQRCASLVESQISGPRERNLDAVEQGCNGASGHVGDAWGMSVWGLTLHGKAKKHRSVSQHKGIKDFPILGSGPPKAP